MFNYNLDKNTVVFTDTLKKGFPYIAFEPRNHESIFFVTKGTLLYEKGNNRAIIEKGQIGYIEKGGVDKSCAYMCDEVSYIAFNFNFGNEDKGSLPFKTLCSTGYAYKYEKLFIEALNCFLMKSPGYLALCNGILLQIIGYLYNELEISDSRMKKMKQIEKGVDYLKNNYHNPEFLIGELSEKCNMSEKNFRRIFSYVYEKTPYAFLQEFRINKAEVLLLNTSKSVSEIALSCGFSDVYSFSHCFKKHNGCSPMQYR